MQMIDRKNMYKCLEIRNLMICHIGFYYTVYSNDDWIYLKFINRKYLEVPMIIAILNTCETLYEFVPLFITAGKVKMFVNKPRIKKIVWQHLYFMFSSFRFYIIYIFTRRITISQFFSVVKMNEWILYFIYMLKI